MKKLFRRSLICLLTTTTAHAGCLAEIVHAEAGGEPFEGQVAVAYAALHHAKRYKRHICRIPAIRKRIPWRLRRHYRRLVIQVRAQGLPDYSRGATHWRTTQFHKFGRPVAKVGRHYFSRGD